MAWGTQNRETPLRRIKSGRWEIRCLDGLANMYFALSAILAAGMLGLASPPPRQQQQQMDYQHQQQQQSPQPQQQQQQMDYQQQQQPPQQQQTEYQQQQGPQQQPQQQMDYQQHPQQPQQPQQLSQQPLQHQQQRSDYPQKDLPVNPSTLDEKGRAHYGVVQKMPTSLDEAVAALQHDEQLVDALPRGFVNEYLTMKGAEQRMLGGMSEQERRAFLIERY